MKQILAVCLLLTAVDAEVSLRSSERPLNRLFHLERWFPLLGHRFTLPGHQFVPPGHSLPTPGQLPLCTIFGDLFPKDQQNKESESCTVVRICHSRLINETETPGTTSVFTLTSQFQTSEGSRRNYRY